MWNKLLEFFRRFMMINKTDVSKIVGAPVALSAPMVSAFQLWAAMYENRSPWLNGDIKSMGLAASISGEIARMTTAEMEVRFTGSRAEYLSSTMARIITRLQNEKLELGLSRGGMVFKPFVSGGKMHVDFVPQDCMYPVHFDASGNLTAVVFSDVRKIGDWYFTRLEYHQMLDDNFYLMQNFFYKSRDKDTLGSQVQNREELPADWQELDTNTEEPIQYIANVTQPLYGYFRFPAPNNVDPASPLGVACFSNAQSVDGGIKLIEQADELFDNLVWEFKSGKRAIYADTTAFEKGKDGKPKLPDRRLYRTLDRTTNIGDKGNLFDEWSPEFREAAINSGLNTILKRIEFSCRLATGTLSDPQSVALTATEVVASRQRSYVTVTSTQKALEDALNGLLYAISVWTDLYSLAPSGSWEVVYEWDDSVIDDKAVQFSQDTQALSLGTMSKVEWRMRQYREPEDVARAKIAEIQKEQAQTADLFSEDGA